MVHAYVAAGLGFFYIQLIYDSENCDSLLHRPAFFAGSYSVLLSVANICELHALAGFEIVMCGRYSSLRRNCLVYE